MKVSITQSTFAKISCYKTMHLVYCVRMQSETGDIVNAKMIHAKKWLFPVSFMH